LHKLQQQGEQAVVELSPPPVFFIMLTISPLALLLLSGTSPSVEVLLSSWSESAPLAFSTTAALT
jgi:hypothetical protein